MKKVIIIFILALIVVFTSSFSFSKGKEYCGKVEEMYERKTSTGEKEYHIVFYSADLKKHLDIQVKKSIYKKTKPKAFICLELKRSQIK